MNNELLKKYRSFIMGISIIWIAIYHIPIKTSIPILRFINETGYGGVDFFVFVAGFGMYYSLKKRDKDNSLDLFSYVKSKMKRLLPSYIPFIVLWMIAKKILHRIYLTEVFGNLTMTGWWNGDENQFNWYIDLLLLLYILGPFFYAIIAHGKKRLWNMLLLIIFLFMVGISFFHGQLILAISRLPIFALGLFIAVCLDEEKEEKIVGLIENKWIWLLISALGIALLYVCRVQTRLDCWHYGLYWYPFFLIVPGVSITLTWLAALLEKNRITNAVVKLVTEIGKASLEIFLFHLAIFEFMQLLGTYPIGVWIAAYFIAFGIGYAYYRIVNTIRKKLFP